MYNKLTKFMNRISISLKISLIAFVIIGIALTIYGSSGQSIARAMANQSITLEDNPFAPAGINDPAAFIKLFKATQAAVAADDKAAVAAFILLPLHVNGPTPFAIRSKEAFIAQYDNIMTKPIKDALAAQKVEELFVRDQGVMVGNGELWFGVIDGQPQRYGLIAVNPVQRNSER
ncbi:hypothetical protein AB4Z29_10545 [Paenibacillus sp. 2TAB23]|uniref:hypothetical protein n=1 Tax=Paenibacillus sp. 2TAB23 TaxID=3233004 RepID=UPI003F94A3F4